MLKLSLFPKSLGAIHVDYTQLLPSCVDAKCRKRQKCIILKLGTTLR
uniref:Uncharacterized protein n=1 Tax=Arundo donax TaxID=35708 RepID=A0A0A8Z5X1_ARUDO